MKKKNLLLFFSILFSTICLFLIHYLKKKNNIDYSYSDTIFWAFTFSPIFLPVLFNLIFQILAVKTKNKAYITISFIFSVITLNIFSIILNSQLLQESNEQNVNNQYNQETNNTIITNNYNNTIITNNYNNDYDISNHYRKVYLICFIINIICLIALVISIIYGIHYVWDNAINNPNNKDGGFIAVGIPALLLILTVGFICLTFFPISILLLAAKLNYDAFKMDNRAYKPLVILGIITLTFVNSYTSYKIVKEMKKQR